MSNEQAKMKLAEAQAIENATLTMANSAVRLRAEAMALITVPMPGALVRKDGRIFKVTEHGQLDTLGNEGVISPPERNPPDLVWLEYELVQDGDSGLASEGVELVDAWQGSPLDSLRDKQPPGFMSEGPETEEEGDTIFEAGFVWNWRGGRWVDGGYELWKDGGNWFMVCPDKSVLVDASMQVLLDASAKGLTAADLKADGTLEPKPTHKPLPSFECSGKAQCSERVVADGGWCPACSKWLEEREKGSLVTVKGEPGRKPWPRMGEESDAEMYGRDCRDGHDHYGSASVAILEGNDFVWKDSCNYYRRGGWVVYLVRGHWSARGLGGHLSHHWKSLEEAIADCETPA